MDIFCRNIPQAVSDKHMAKEFRPILERYGLVTFKCRKNGPKTAIITVIDKDKALTLLAIHGQQPGQKRRPPQPIKLFGQPIYLEPSRRAPENLLLRSLEQSEENRQTSLASKSIYGPEPPLTKDNRSLLVLGMSCGVWAYDRDVPVFYECYSWGFSGVLVFRQRSIKVDLKEKYSNDIFAIDFAYSNLHSIFTGHGKSSFTITTRAPPKLYHSSEEEQQKAREAKMNRRNVPSRSRVGHFPLDQEASAGCCYTYRFVLQDAKDMTLAKSLGRKFHAPEMYQWRDSVGRLAHSFQSHIKYFIERLRVETIPYRVKFQLQALIWNGHMSPLQAIGFLAHVKRILNTADEEIVARALGRLKTALVFPSPDVQGWEVQIQNVVGALSGIIKELNKEKNSGIAPQRIHPNMVNIHHVTVTPCAMFLAGPKQEAKNRVLRKYEGFTDYFLRVNFTDEDGGPVRFDFKANTDKIFHDRFKNILKQGIDIGGRHFNYLGFSHSSLRSQTCWFVAPFRTSDGRTWSAETIINNLGIFTQIKSPSKMAARIGQTFSDTVASIEIPPESVVRMNDVERNGRCFSDGVGTISLSIARKIWRQYGSKAPKRPTVFQIRYAGAKGMVSLDSRLAGDQLCLRNSMIKFEATGSAIEICGSGIRALPFYLNQQLIKILEDLGVPPSAFMRLQRQEIDRLRSTPGSVSKAADFLEGTHIPRSINFPWLIRTLEKELQLSFRDDPFLRALVNLAILIRLRDLKYRARIPVSQAVTLYGVMDETGYLKENEIYCAMTGEDGRTQVLVRNEVVITRSPALHPGDIQIVNAVNVDIPNHPLTLLHNCVVFSQHGSRDLPSMLSGGDLDGDLYNVIYDETLMPGIIPYEPAEYPPTEERVLDRPVETADIIDFFVTFMQQDQLGRIATVHQILADQCPNGTLDQQCLSLAELHSAAVDFSKSGTPADLSKMPRVKPYRPDFMAPGPRVRIADDIGLVQENDIASKIDFDDPADDDEPRPTQYYKSHKILGVLYRAIDENKFFNEIKDAIEPSSTNVNVLDQVWKYVQSQVAGFQWKHLTEKAEGIKELYEGQMHNLMSNFSETSWTGACITEYEVILGTILGQGQKQSRLNKEQSKSLRDEYEDLVDLVVSTIHDSEEARSEGLELSVACFHIAIRDHELYMNFARRVSSRNRDSTKVLSFAWIAATVCLKEVIKFKRDNIPVFLG